MKSIWDIKETEKVAVVDFDDVLCDSIGAWITYVNLQKMTSFKDLKAVKRGLCYDEYKELKTQYRDSNMKLYIHPKPDAFKFMSELKNKGYTIIILTRRPFSLHKNLYSLSKKWLENNNIIYDALLFEDKKHFKIIGDLETIDFLVEDNRIIANSLAKFNIKCFLLDNIYNQGELRTNVIRVKSLLEIFEHIK